MRYVLCPWGSCRPDRGVLFPWKQMKALTGAGLTNGKIWMLGLSYIVLAFGGSAAACGFCPYYNFMVISPYRRKRKRLTLNATI